VVRPHDRGCRGKSGTNTREGRSERLMTGAVIGSLLGLPGNGRRIIYVFESGTA
jgi:hypothetical protein